MENESAGKIGQAAKVAWDIYSEIVRATDRVSSIRSHRITYQGTDQCLTLFRDTTEVPGVQGTANQEPYYNRRTKLDLTDRAIVERRQYFGINNEVLGSVLIAIVSKSVLKGNMDLIVVEVTNRNDKVEQSLLFRVSNTNTLASENLTDKIDPSIIVEGEVVKTIKSRACAEEPETQLQLGYLVEEFRTGMIEIASSLCVLQK